MCPESHGVRGDAQASETLEHTITASANKLHPPLHHAPQCAPFKSHPSQLRWKLPRYTYPCQKLSLYLPKGMLWCILLGGVTLFPVFASNTIDYLGVDRSHLHYLGYPILDIARESRCHSIQETFHVQGLNNTLWGSQRCGDRRVGIERQRTNSNTCKHVNSEIHSHSEISPTALMRKAGSELKSKPVGKGLCCSGSCRGFRSGRRG